MSNSTPDRIVDQLRANLRAAGIAATDADIEGMAAKGFLARVAAFETLVARTPSDTVPDYLDWWAERGATSHEHVELIDGGQGEIGPLAFRIRNRDVSPVELTEQALAEIERDDPQLNAFQRVLAERARESARRAEQDIAAGQYRGPLHGVPVAVKDLLALRGTPTTAGTRILADNVAAFDAAAVERLDAAGAVIVGKTRMSEFAYSPGSNNAHYGPTRNPRSLEYDAGGSSSGSGAAVAAGFVYAALGTDTGGSIRIPAALCGIVGLKPTFGRASLYGAVTLAWSLDHIGPLTRTVPDAALLLDILAGYDARDPRTRPSTSASRALATLEDGVRGVRVGVLRDDGTGKALGGEAQLEAWRRGVDALQQAGAILVDIDMPELEDLRTVQGALLPIEAATYHEPMLRERLDDYGEFMRQRILAAFAFGNRAFTQAQQIRAVLRRRCMAAFDSVDVITTPSQPDAGPPLGTPASTQFTGPFNTLGWPALSLPVGALPDGRPLGMQIAGRPWDEATVLRAARAVETVLSAQF